MRLKKEADFNQSASRSHIYLYFIIVVEFHLIVVEPFEQGVL